MQHYFALCGLLLLQSAYNPFITSVETSVAEMKAVRYARRLGAPESLRITVRAQDHPNYLINATTVKDEGRLGCTIRIRRDKLWDSETVAHETCHCVLDFEHMTPYGYKSYVTEAQWRAMEMRARECGKRIAREDVYGRVEEKRKEDALCFAKFQDVTPRSRSYRGSVSSATPATPTTPSASETSKTLPSSHTPRPPSRPSKGKRRA